jgi:hypothetical protein
MANERKHDGSGVRSWRRLLGGDWSASPVDQELQELDDDLEDRARASPTLWEAEVVALSDEALFSTHDAAEDVL